MSTPGTGAGDDADPLRPARGILIGLVLGTHFWGLVIGAVLIWHAHR